MSDLIYVGLGVFLFVVVERLCARLRSSLKGARHV